MNEGITAVAANRAMRYLLEKYAPSPEVGWAWIQEMYALGWVYNAYDLRGTPGVRVVRGFANPARKGVIICVQIKHAAVRWVADPEASLGKNEFGPSYETPVAAAVAIEVSGGQPEGTDGASTSDEDMTDVFGAGWDA